MQKIVIFYFLFLFSFFSFFSSGVIDSIDGFQYLAVARNIYYTGGPTAQPYGYDTGKNIFMTYVVGKDGKGYSTTGLGYSIAYVPAVFITDIVYKLYGVSPSVHFPLENDWLIFLIAGFTNSFFAALLGVTLFLYLIATGLPKKPSLLISFVGMVSTNLFVYSKHSFAHMMFISLLFLSFYFTKRHFQTKKPGFLILAGLAFGLCAITYNQTFLFAIPPLGIYILLLNKFKFNRNAIESIIKKILIFFAGLLPFIVIYLWFENLRAGGSQNLANPATLTSRALTPFRTLQLGVFIEGLYGQLFSPGRSFFIYSPLIVLVIMFWHKIKKNVYPELLIFLLLSAIYVLFFASQYSIGRPDQGIAGLWHGESSWGPRYLTPLIPFGLLIVGNLYLNISKKIKLFIFYPLVLIGLFVQILGILLPYQVKLHNLEYKFLLNGAEYHASLYSNFLPRYTPILNMSKEVMKLAKNLPNTFNHGIYNARFYDGIDLPFNVGPERWRVVEGRGYISFDNNKPEIKEVTFKVINHPLSESSESAQLSFVLNDQPLLSKPRILEVGKKDSITVSVPQEILKPKNNQLIIQVEYNPSVEIKQNGRIVDKKQILALTSFEINQTNINLESIDVPYVSQLGPKIAGVNYLNWGGTNQDPWKFWDIHTQTFERLPDFWWIRNLYYWDVPKSWILGLLTINVLGIILSGLALKKTFKNE